MNYYLIDFNENNNYTFDNVIIGKKITTNNNDNISKYYIYYFESDINISPQIIYNNDMNDLHKQQSIPSSTRAGGGSSNSRISKRSSI